MERICNDCGEKWGSNDEQCPCCGSTDFRDMLVDEDLDCEDLEEDE